MPKPNITSLPLVVLGSVLFSIGCGGAQGTQPDDMSADEHRAAADAEDQEAAAHRDQYDPEATDLRPRGVGGEYEFSDEAYNPTAMHDASARGHADTASQHRQAADVLESFELERCRSFAPTTRALCPLLGQLASVDDVANGARLTFHESVNGEAAHAHVACHVAFARTQGREGMNHCPMYVDGVRAEMDSAGATILVAEDAASIASIRQRARAHLE